RWANIVDFLKLHYVLSQRTDSAYWLDNKNEKSIPENLQELISLWRYQPPYHYDATHTEEMFPPASFQYILYGMNFVTDPLGHKKRVSHADKADKFFNDNIKKTQKLLSILPTNREIINKIKKYGLPKI
ncbi:MAG: tryptophan halogenase, partial [Colwellia sp.]